MSQFKRRDFLKISAGLAAGAGAPLIWMKHAHAQWNNAPEKGARLRVLRWSRFVQGDIDQYLANVKKFEAKYGIPVRVDNETWEDVRPKAAVAANTGAGPDIILGTNDDANLYPEKLVDVTDLANYLGSKYGGWYPVCEAYLRPEGKRWIGIPLGAAGSMMVYRESMLRAAGFSSFPKDTDAFLRMMKALKDKGTPGGFALGHATGDANTWCHWLVWSFGGKMVDKSNKVVIDSPETLRALEYSRELYGTFVPGTLSWLDPSNNKAFLDGQISLTNNGISIYTVAKNSTDPALQAIAKDMDHVNFPIGPVGVPTEYSLMLQAFVFKYSKYPKAAKEYLRYMWEGEQYMPWQQASNGYVSQPLVAFEKNPIWTADPKNTPFRDATKKMRYNGYAGTLGYASAAVIGDFISLAHDDVFLLSNFNTLLYTVVASIIKFALGLYLALLLNTRVPYRGMIRAIVLLPFVVPTVLSAIAFWWIYDAQFSIISWVLIKAGLITRYIDFLGDPWNARWSVVAANIWRGVPFVAITLLAGLQTISPSLYEAANLDGATNLQRFRHITLPMLSPIIAVVMTFSVLLTFTDFQLIYTITRGGPINATHLMATLSFERAITGGHLGEGAAIADAMVPFLLGAILFSYFGLQRRRWQQGSRD